MDEENHLPPEDIDDAKRDRHSSGYAQPGEDDSKDEVSDTTEGESINEKPGERSSRLNAAKAFYRAMYAGEDVVPDDFGMKLEETRSTISADSPAGRGAYDKELERQLALAEAKASENEGLYRRMAADFDNYRKRTDREREELLGLGIQKAVESLLPAIDDLDRAQATFNENSEAKSVVESLKLLYNRFNRCLEQLGVKPLESIGTPFDPRLHEPVQQVESTKYPEGSVVHDLRRGYLLKDKVIRPSLVNVAVNSLGAEESDETQKHEDQMDEGSNVSMSHELEEGNSKEEMAKGSPGKRHSKGKHSGKKRVLDE